MPYNVDIGGAPANADCAQLGRTPDFERANRLEVAAYKAAIIARFGPPPEGCALVELRNPHDFGTYYTLGVRIADEDAAIAEAAAYLDDVEEGLGSWVEAGFTSPVTYDSASRATALRPISEVIIGALQTTRPSADGTFPVADFEKLHRNLAAAYPAEVAEAAARLSVPAYAAEGRGG